MSQKLSIGKLSEQTGVHIETIRYYEKIDLLPKPCRSAGGHRIYSHEQKSDYISSIVVANWDLL